MTELIQACEIPIYVWNDDEWMPYRNNYNASYKGIGYSLHVNDFYSFVKTNFQIMMKEKQEKSENLALALQDYYTYAGIMKQIRIFMDVFEPNPSLTCQKHPAAAIEIPPYATTAMAKRKKKKNV